MDIYHDKQVTNRKQQTVVKKREYATNTTTERYGLDDELIQDFAWMAMKM